MSKSILYGFNAAISNYRQICIFCLHRVHRMSRRFILNFTLRQRSILDLKRVKQEKAPCVKIKKKTGLKKANKVKV